MISSNYELKLVSFVTTNPFRSGVALLRHPLYSLQNRNKKEDKIIKQKTENPFLFFSLKNNFFQYRLNSRTLRATKHLKTLTAKKLKSDAGSDLELFYGWRARREELLKCELIRLLLKLAVSGEEATKKAAIKRLFGEEVEGSGLAAESSLGRGRRSRTG